MIPQEAIYLNASDPDACITDPPHSSYNSGIWIDALAAFSTVADESSRPDNQLISKSYVAAMTASNWHSADGILRMLDEDGKTYHADANMPRGLSMLYQRTDNAQFKSDIEKYLAVQYNAILELGTTNGSDIYSFDWIGPAPSTFTSDGQVTALGVLVPVIALPDIHSPSDSNSTPNPTPSSPSSNKTPVGGIVGGVVGGILVLAALTGLCLVRRHRKKTSYSSTQEFDDPGHTHNFHVEPFMESPNLVAERSRSPWGQGGSPKGGAARRSILDNGEMLQRPPALSTPVLQPGQEDDRQLLRQMGATLNILNQRLARAERTSTMGGGTDAPPEYPGSIQH
ncbi:hypothetical protein V5O48_011567 [Marasmius crinis-equi]|uniref:Uncharacterized protein n=1 Tax=Marasmius crinis-equi TaxID=585013 RepID=A0ABR3F5K9_9AGAR